MMQQETGLRAHQTRLLSLKFIVFLLIYSLIGVLGWTGWRINQLGDRIVKDGIAPAGAGHLIDGGGMVADASAGQCVVGLSESPAGGMLYHGVHGPLTIITRNAAQQWQMY